MDLFEELEHMALNAASETSETIDDETVTRWQTLFSYSYLDAKDRIESHRNNFSRVRVTDEHWEIIGKGLKAQGYDREAYEYELGMGAQKGKPPTPSSTGAGNSHAQYIVKLEGPLTTQLIQQISGLEDKPELMEGSGEEGDAKFCLVSATTKNLLAERFASTSFRPAFARFLGPAEKNLSAYSPYPMLGLDIDTTLPQHRANSSSERFLPEQDQYPVWYFFYGTLAIPEVLIRHLGLKVEPQLFPALVRGGKLKTWARKYKALVDAPGEKVEGWAYLVVDKEMEDALKAYETGNYEVVRCVIEGIEGMEEGVRGCTFRFVGVVD